MIKHQFCEDKYLDFHTHRQKRKGQSNIIEIISICDNNPPKDCFFTIGIHPWFTEKMNHFDLEYLQSDYCLGIGEIGLDAIQGEELAVQIMIFKQQLKLAEHSQKPVVIHCVRAFELLLKIKNEFPTLKKWCVHGFNRNKRLAQQLIEHGFYISIAPQTLQNKKDLIESIPINRLFLETDDNENLLIENLYLQASQILKKSEIEFKKQLINNAKTFFYNE